MPLATSVVIPSYNHAAYLDAALSSVLDVPTSAHEAPEREVIVIDDGSTDSSLEILHRRARQDPRLRVIAQENRGAHAALNRGVALATGDVVFILNSDDTFHPDRLPRFLERFAAEAELRVLVSWIEIVDGDGASIGVKEGWRNMPPWTPRHASSGLAATDDPVLALVEANWVSTTSNVAVRRDLANQVPFLALRYAHDWDFLLGAARLGGFGVVEEPLVRYRVHGSNTIREQDAAEQDAAERARGLMRFEALWVVCRHAGSLCDAPRRFWSSLPPFASDSLVAQLLELRGGSESVPAGYDQLLEEGHPLREAAVRILGRC